MRPSNDLSRSLITLACDATVRRLDELIEEAREHGLPDDAIADALEDAAGALRAGLS
jgi:hypothetical protein